MKLHHIGIATDDIEKTVAYLKKIMKVKKISETIWDSNQEVYLSMITLEDNSNIELICGKKVESFIKKGTFIYHICYEVKNIDFEIENIVKNGGFIISQPTEAILFNERKVAFIYTNIGIVELLEENIQK